MDNAFKKIDDQASNLVEADLDTWVVSDLMTQLAVKIDSAAIHAYGPQNGATVAVLAFRERAKQEVRAACVTFFFKLKHWQDNGRSIGPYLIRVISRLSDRLYWESHHAKKASLPVCPGCKEDNRREYLTSEGKLLRCANCTHEAARISTEMKSTKVKNDRAILSLMESKMKRFNAFAVHSRKGYKCPDCTKFVPESVNGKFGIACPFEDCMFFGTIDEMELMSHPVTIGQRPTISMNQEIKASKQVGHNTMIVQDTFSADTIQADVQIAVRERNIKEYETLVQVINEQLEQIKRTNSNSTMVQKVLMYEAFKSMINKYPEEMISYLVHEKQSADFPLQARIFQEYASLVENYLPFSIEKKNETIDIVDLTDHNLSLFEGVSTFKADVECNGQIPNKTEETYTGGRKFKHYGSCFIGMIIDVVDADTGLSIKDKVKEYSFVSITMDKTVLKGTKVIVTHFRIPPHYEMDSMVHLQRARKAIVNSVHFRLNKSKRVARKPVSQGVTA